MYIYIYLYVHLLIYIRKNACVYLCMYIYIYPVRYARQAATVPRSEIWRCKLKGHCCSIVENKTCKVKLSKELYQKYYGKI